MKKITLLFINICAFWNVYISMKTRSVFLFLAPSFNFVMYLWKQERRTTFEIKQPVVQTSFSIEYDVCIV